MSPDEIPAVLTRLNSSQVAAAHLVGVDPRSMRRWCSRDQPVAPAAERLLWLLDRVSEMLAIAQDRRQSGYGRGVAANV